MCNVFILHSSHRPLLSEAIKPEKNPLTQPSIQRQLNPESETTTIAEDLSDKGERVTVTSDKDTTDDLPAVDGAELVKCGCLVEFVRCYGPVLDSVRLKQLLCSREWAERKTCLTTITQLAELAATGQWYFCVALCIRVLHA